MKVQSCGSAEPIPLHVFDFSQKPKRRICLLEREGLVCSLHENFMIVIVTGIGEGPPFHIDT
jgi:hypothetical protein